MPFGPFDSFDDCVDRLSSEADIGEPEGLCAWLHHEWTGEWPSAAKIVPPDPAALKKAPSDGIMVALFPSTEVARQLALPGGEDPDQLHITLAYLGTVDELEPDMLAELPAVVALLAVGLPGPLAGEIAGAGRFTADPEQHVFWAAVDVPGLERVQRAVADGLAAAGYQLGSEHGFTPHMTLAYLDPGAPDPTDELPALALSFDEVVLAIADERHRFGMEADMTTATKQTAEELRQRLDVALRERLGEDAMSLWVRDFDPTEQWAVYELSSGADVGSFRVAYNVDADGTVTIAGDAAPVEVEIHTEYTPKRAELTGPIVRKDDAKRIVYGAVLVPGEPDLDGDVLSADKIEEVAHTWLEKFQLIDDGHELTPLDASPVESYVEPAERAVELDGAKLTLPAGTWVMAAKVRDDAVWGEIASGKRTGFSIMGVANDQLSAALASLKSGDRAAFKRVTLADVGGGDPNGDWSAPMIGIVDAPAVPKAKFFALKQSPAAGPLQRLAAWLGVEGDASRGQPAAKNQGQHGPSKEDPMDQKKVQELITGAVKSAVTTELKPVTDRIDALEAAGKQDPPPDGDPAAPGDDAQAGAEALTEAVKAAVEAALKADLLPRIEKLEQRTRATSRQVGDDDEPATKSAPTRDAYGRRIA